MNCVQPHKATTRPIVQLSCVAIRNDCINIRRIVYRVIFYPITGLKNHLNNSNICTLVVLFYSIVFMVQV